MRLYDILLAKKLSGGGGGEAVLINKNISSNGTYNASTDNADGYKKVVVSVPNTYVAGDEGKVVSNGTLVSQTSETYTTNNTYDTTLINSVTVNVPSGWNPNDVAEETVPSGALVLDTATSIGKYAFASRTGLTSVSAPECLELKERAFAFCTALTSAFVPKAQTIGTYLFDGCTSLTAVAFPSATSMDGRIFNNCSALTIADIPKSIPNQFANGATALRALVLRKDSLAALPAWNSATLGGIYNHPTESTIYVPQSLIDSYKSASNWVTGHNAGLTFAKIEGTYYETHYADGTPI